MYIIDFCENTLLKHVGIYNCATKTQLVKTSSRHSQDMLYCIACMSIVHTHNPHTTIVLCFYTTRAVAAITTPGRTNGLIEFKRIIFSRPSKCVRVVDIIILYVRIL